jgi:hypothetical protein
VSLGGLRRRDKHGSADDRERNDHAKSWIANDVATPAKACNHQQLTSPALPALSSDLKFP